MERLEQTRGQIIPQGLAGLFLNDGRNQISTHIAVQKMTARLIYHRLTENIGKPVFTGRVFYPHFKNGADSMPAGHGHCVLYRHREQFFIRLFRKIFGKMVGHTVIQGNEPFFQSKPKRHGSKAFAHRKNTFTVFFPPLMFGNDFAVLANFDPVDVQSALHFPKTEPM